MALILRKIINKALLFMFLINMNTLIQAEKPPLSHGHHCSAVHKYTHATSTETGADIDVTWYFLDLFVNDTTTKVSGNTTISFKLLKTDNPEIIFDLAETMKIDSALLNNKLVNVIHTNDVVTIPSEDIDDTEGIQTVQIYYNGLAGNGGFFSGMSSGYVSRWDLDVTWTLSEPYSAKDWFPVKQSLSDKADSVRVHLTVPKGLKAGSIGLLQDVVALGDTLERYEWKSDYPIAFYLISLAVSDYQDYSFYTKLPGLDDSLLVQNYIYNHPDALGFYKEDIDNTADMLQVFSELFGLYPFAKEKYGHCLAPMGGGMEHQTMTTLSNFNFDLVSHELGHQWFGDYITCGSWQDIWINEGFASYTEYLAREFIISKESAQEWLVSTQAGAKRSPEGSVYVPEESLDAVWRIFSSSLSYDKGACLLHMLRYEINNDALFFELLKTYVNQYANSFAVAEDFKSVAENVTGTDFGYFFDQWYYGEGYPNFDISWRYKNDSLEIYASQKGSAESTPWFSMHLELLLEVAGAEDTILRVFQDKNHQVFKFHLPGINIDNVVFDPSGAILKESRVRKLAVFDGDYAVAPNPFSDSFTLLFKNYGPVREVTIINTTGKIIEKKTGRESEMIIDMAAYANGIYVLNIKADEKRYSAKIVKQQ